MQSWGTQGRYGLRDTEREPSKSAVLGLVGAALGMSRDDDAMLARLASLSMAVRVDREGTWMRDYHTVGGGRFRGRTHGIGGNAGETAPTERHYLADASFLVALGSEDRERIDAIAAALRDPVWPLFLGRKSCVPSAPVFAGIVDASPRDALAGAPLQSSERRLLRLVVECGSSDGVPRQDVPESFAMYARRHGVRFVRTEQIEVATPLGGDSAEETCT